MTNLKNILFIFGVFFVAMTATVQAKSWSYFFYIAGDNDYMGPTYLPNKTLHEDQAKRLYGQLSDFAKRDRVNNYIIFYDPKGRGFLSLNKYVRFRYYQQGRLVYTNGVFESEIDMTDSSTFRRFFELAEKKITNLSQTQKMFYYYGEHIPLRYEEFYDLNAKEKKMFLQNSFLDDLELFVTHFQKFDLLIMQACYSNNMEFLKRAKKIAGEIVVGKLGVPRAAPLLSSFFESSLTARELKNLFVSENQTRVNDHFDLVAYSSSDLNTLDSFDSLDTSRSFNKVGMCQDVHAIMDRAFRMDFASAQTRIENFESPAIVFKKNKEVMIGLNDFLGFYFQYANDLSLLDQFLFDGDELKRIETIYVPLDLFCFGSLN